MQTALRNERERARYAECIEVSKPSPLGDRARRHPRAAASTPLKKYLPDGPDAGPRPLGSWLRGEPPLPQPDPGGGPTPTSFGPRRALQSTPRSSRLGLGYSFGDQVALEAMVRFSDEELKHQRLFRPRRGADRGWPCPRATPFVADPNAVAARGPSRRRPGPCSASRSTSSSSPRSHYRQSIETDADLSPLFKDVFRFHWVEESQHAILDEARVGAARTVASSEEARDAAVGDPSYLAGRRARRHPQGRKPRPTPATSSSHARGAPFEAPEISPRLEAGVLAAYRWQHILSGADNPRFVEVLASLVNSHQLARIVGALATLR